MAGSPPNWTNKAPVSVNKEKVSKKSRVTLKPEQFDELLKQQGVRIKIYRTLLCPNVKSIDGAEHDIDCPICKSSGFIDLNPIDSWALLTDQTLEKSVQAEGYIDHSSAKATFLSGVTLQYFARIEVPDHYDTFIERIKRQRGQVDRLKYPAVSVNVVFDGQRQYYSGTDFNLTPTGDLNWLPGKGPDPEAIYAIHYEIVLQYRAVQALHVNRFAQAGLRGNIQFVRMPECWIVQKIYLADRKDFQGNSLHPNLIRPPDDPNT